MTATVQLQAVHQSQDDVRRKQEGRKNREQTVEPPGQTTT